MARDLSTIFGKRLRSAREAAGLTQLQAAVKLGCTPNSISHWERGVTRVAVVDLLNLAKVYDVTPASMLEGL